MSYSIRISRLAASDIAEEDGGFGLGFGERTRCATLQRQRMQQHHHHQNNQRPQPQVKSGTDQYIGYKIFQMSILNMINFEVILDLDPVDFFGTQNISDSLSDN